MNLIQKSAAFLLLSGILLLAGCQEEEMSEPTSEANTSLNDHHLLPMEQLTQEDHQMIAFAKSLAASLKDEQIRDFIKTEALKAFDGDYDILYELVKNQKIGQSSLSARLAENLQPEDAPANAKKDKAAFFNQQLENMPLLNIAMPVHIENWQTESHIPMVAMLLSDYDDSKSKLLRAFDAEGNMLFLDAKVPPGVPTVVVGFNERMIPIENKNGGKKGQIIYQARYEQDEPGCMLRTARLNESKSKSDYITSRVTYRCGGGGGGPVAGGQSTGGGCNSCDRDCLNGKEYIKNIKFHSEDVLYDLEGWGGGKIELIANVYYPGALGGKGYMRQVFHSDRDAYRGCRWLNCWVRTYTVNRKLLTWNKSETDRMWYQWIEEDFRPSSTKMTSSFSFDPDGSGPETSTNITFEFQSKDDFLGDVAVEYDDCADGSYTYKNNYLQFNVMEK
jgi:hypothetical protein